MMSDRTIVSVYSYLRRLHLANFLQLIDDDKSLKEIVLMIGM